MLTKQFVKCSWDGTHDRIAGVAWSSWPGRKLKKWGQPAEVQLPAPSSPAAAAASSCFFFLPVAAVLQAGAGQGAMQAGAGAGGGAGARGVRVKRKELLGWGVELEWPNGRRG